MARYQRLHKSGQLQGRVEQAVSRLEHCDLCPNKCLVNRLAGEVGKCNTGRDAWVSSYSLHFGEEQPLVGSHGSGTIFFTHCNLKCCFCQNFSISQLGEGRAVTGDELAKMMLSLQKRGCHNINFVSPTHVVPQILEALELAVDAGLSIPLVYNSGGYDSVETLRILDGIIDIYMPDMKYSNDNYAERFSGIKNYPERNREAVREMYRQVGDLQLDDLGIAQTGLLIRHLVLPEGIAGTYDICKFLGEEISVDTYLNIMAQYRPCFRAFDHPELSRSITLGEYREAVKIADNFGLKNLDSIKSRTTNRIMQLFED